MTGKRHSSIYDFTPEELRSAIRVLRFMLARLEKTTKAMTENPGESVW